MNPGRMDRRITLQSRTLGRGSEGGSTVTWSDVTTLWAETVQPASGSEINRGENDRTVIRQNFRIRFYPGISATTHRIVYAGQTYNLIHAAEEGRKAYHLLTCEYTEDRA